VIVLDTCSLVWWTLDAGRLSPRARRACRRAESTKAVVSSISIWEIGIKVERGRLDLGTSLEDFVVRLKSAGSVEIVSVSDAIWLRNLRLVWNHRDQLVRYWSSSATPSSGKSAFQPSSGGTMGARL